MIFDTDVLIWLERGNLNAKKAIEKTNGRYISIQTRMELFQAAPSKKNQQITADFLKTFNFKVLSLTENIGYRASIYVEEFSLSHGVLAANALIAATAIENNLPLLSGNKKHFKIIPNLNLKVFKS